MTRYLKREKARYEYSHRVLFCFLTKSRWWPMIETDNKFATEKTMSQPRLVRLILWVENPALLCEWYRTHFEWQELFRDEEAGWIELDANGFILALHGGSDLEARRWPKIQIAVDNVLEHRNKLQQSGIKMSQIYTWKHLEWAECSDPEGNTVQICNA
jgi:predicted enzyme related to lactoylglutathione lyase